MQNYCTSCYQKIYKQALANARIWACFTTPYHQHNIKAQTSTRLLAGEWCYGTTEYIFVQIFMITCNDVCIIIIWFYLIWSVIVSFHWQRVRDWQVINYGVNKLITTLQIYYIYWDDVLLWGWPKRPKLVELQAVQLKICSFMS